MALRIHIVSEEDSEGFSGLLPTGGTVALWLTTVTVGLQEGGIWKERLVQWEGCQKKKGKCSKTNESNHQRR